MESCDDVLVSNYRKIMEKENFPLGLKLIGFERRSGRDVELLDLVSDLTDPGFIHSIFFDSNNNFYVVFLQTAEAAMQLLEKEVWLDDKSGIFLPLFDHYVIDNVYPFVSNKDLAHIIEKFNVVLVNVKKRRCVPNNIKYAHVLSGKRELIFLLRNEDRGVELPKNIVHAPYMFYLSKSCWVCSSEGHRALECGNREVAPAMNGSSPSGENGVDQMLNSASLSD